MKQRRGCIGRSSSLSIRSQCKLLSLHRSGYYYQPVGESEENLVLMKRMDELFLSDPTLGVLGMQDELRELGMNYNVKRIRRFAQKNGDRADLS